MAVCFLFNVQNGTSEYNFNPNTIYYYNGHINEIQGVHNTEELKYIRSTYKENYGTELKSYTWDAKTNPVHVRIFGVLNPGAHSTSIQNAIRKLQEQANKYIAIYHDPKWFTASIALKIRAEANLTSEQIGIAYPGNKFAVLDAFTECDYHWAKINYQPSGSSTTRVAYIAMGHIDGTEYGIKE